MSVEMIVTIDTSAGGTLLAPVGLSGGAATLLGIQVDGADATRLSEASLGQEALLLTPRGDRVLLRYGFDPTPAPEPDAMFAPHDSRYTRAHQALAAEARDIVAAGGIEALVAHVAALFDYGHPDALFYDGTDAMPQLCDLTTGSCVDINAYLIASARAAGIEAGYLAGYFIPVERRDHTVDMHCWVATRAGGTVRYWDIAHHLKMGRRDIASALNPKPGVRVAMSHSMGWTLPGVPHRDFKLLGEPVWFDDDGWRRADCTFVLAGYDALDAVQNRMVSA